MKRFLLTLAFFCFAAGMLTAKDEVTLRSKEKAVTGLIKSESPRGIVMGAATIAADDIADIFYDVADVKFGPYSGARAAEKDSLDPTKEAKRKDSIQSAIKKYRETYDKIKEKPAKRHMQYKIAMLQVRLALDEDEPAETAIKALVEFKTNHGAGWQITSALTTLAHLHMGRAEYKEAVAIFNEMAELDIADDAKLDAQIQAATVSIRAKKHDEAIKTLKGLEAKLPKGSKHLFKAQIGIAECLAAQDKAAEASVLLRGLIKETTDKGLKASAYNALGESLMKKELYKEARWEFLYVDLIYNQDRLEHARALYQLAKVLDFLGEGDRALECRKQLADDRAFAGLEFQRLAQRELAEDKKGKVK